MEFKKNDAINKLLKNPFLVALFVIVVCVASFVVFTLSKAMDAKIQELESAKTTTPPTTQSQPLFEDTVPENTVETGVIKKYSELVDTVHITKEASRIAVTVSFIDEGALLEEHYAHNAFSVDVVPVFHFYMKDGTKVELPGELRLLSDSKSVVYYLSEIKDFSNVISVAESKTITLDNIMLEDFNLYLRHNTRAGVGRTIIGTYGQTVEQYKGLHSPVPAKTVDVSDDIKLVEKTSTDKFIWLDIYFKDEDTYNKYNTKLKSNFICFGLENGGKLYKWDFIVTEYDNLNMLRCKFDDYSLAELLKVMEKKNITVKQLFEDFNIQVWCSDYTTETDMFCLNETIDVREKIKKGTAQTE